MEWNRGPGQTQPTNQSANQPVNHGGASHGKAKSSPFNLRIISVGLLFCLTILMVALVSFIAFNDTKSPNEDVDKSKMQAVFLTGGQVYFGKITNLDDKFVRLSNIYYLRVNQQVQPDGSASKEQNIALVKLGCELHGPQDSMVINQSQVIFWENLTDDGQVGKAVAEFLKQNPDGKCKPAAATETDTTKTTPDTTTTTPPTTKKP